MVKTTLFRNCFISRTSIVISFLFFLINASTPWVNLLEFDLIIQNVKLFDGYKVINNATLLIKDGEIKSIIENSTIDYSASNVVNGKGQTLIPGLINAHVHAFMPQNLKEAASAGVLTLVDLFNASFAATAQRSFRDSVEYAYYYSSGFAVTAPGGHTTQYGFPVPTITKASDAEQFVQDRIDEGSDFIKLILEPGTADDPIPTLSDSVLSRVLQLVKEKGLTSVVHISYRADAVKAATLGASGIAHIWKRDSTDISEVELKTLVDNDVFLIPTLLVRKRILESDPSSKNMKFEQMQKEILKLYESGITILAGTDPPAYGINFGSDLITEIQLLVELGLPEIEALKAATSNISERFRLGQKGYIKVGNSADFVLVNGDPFSEISDLNNVAGVWKKGVRIKN